MVLFYYHVQLNNTNSCFYKIHKVKIDTKFAKFIMMMLRRGYHIAMEKCIYCCWNYSHNLHSSLCPFHRLLVTFKCQSKPQISCLMIFISFICFPILKLCTGNIERLRDFIQNLLLKFKGYIYFFKDIFSLK